MRLRVRVQVSPRAAVALPQGAPRRVSLPARVVRLRESRHPRAVRRAVARAVIPAMHVMIAAQLPDLLTRDPLDRQVVLIPVTVVRVRVVRIPVTVVRVRVVRIPVTVVRVRVVRILATVAQDPVVPIPEPPGRQIVGMTDVLMIAGRQLASAVVDRVALRPQIAEVRLADDQVPVPLGVQMIDTIAMSARSAPSVFVSLILLMRSRQISSTSRSPLNCAPCPMG